ncbi:MAG: cytosine permease [Candidatus Obscuribacterales bacterium]|nr:cytosine permease [Candidatus Obscuribacterales bacterium]
MDLEHSRLGEAINSNDHTTDIVPLSERRGPLIMGLLWITMVTGFPAVLSGFFWYQHGLTLIQVLLCSVISLVILLAYSIPACHLGTMSGQTYAVMTRSLFGRIGSILVSINVAWISLAWYGLAALLLANGLKGIFEIPIDTMMLSVIIAIVMSVNNLFGFSGVANFAGYLAAPVLIVWIALTFFKALQHTPVAVLSVEPHVAMPQALTLVSALIIGNTAWGNEPDYWRYAKPRIMFTVIPLTISIAIGQILFPVTGWMLARETGITDFQEASGLMTRYALGDASYLAALVLIVTYWGLNDANLYASINGVANLKNYPRKALTMVLTVIGALASALLSKNSNAMETVCSLSSTVLPCATIIMMAEWILAKKANREKDLFSTVPAFSELPAIKWPAVIAFASGSALGIFTSGVIPGLDLFKVGVSSLQAWLVTLIVYLLLRKTETASRSS